MRQLDLQPKTWGGRRSGAGRKPNPGRRNVPHCKRPLHDPRCPAHVTLRACSGVPSLRDKDLLPLLRTTLRASSNDRFRVVAFSVQADHLHLLVEADEPTGFERGIRGLAIRVARAVNRAWGRRGRFWGDRYHAHLLRKPREVRNALVYVLNNVRKHFPTALGLDPFSSARWFDGWDPPIPPVAAPSPVVAARTWLARAGWRRAGGIRPTDSPAVLGARRRRRRRRR